MEYWGLIQMEGEEGGREGVREGGDRVPLVVCDSQ